MDTKFILLFLLLHSITLAQPILDKNKGNCFSHELNNFISNTSNNSNEFDENEVMSAASNFKKSLSIIIEKRNEKIKDFNSFEKNKDLTITGLAEVAKMGTPLSAPLLSMGQKITDYERQDRIFSFEKINDDLVKQKIKEGMENMPSSIKREELEELLNNEDVSVFELGSPATVYNNELIKKLKLLGDEDSKKILTIISKEADRIDEANSKHAEGMRKLAIVELNAVQSYFKNKDKIDYNKKQIAANKNNIIENRMLIEQNALMTSILETAIVNHDHRITNNTESILDIQTQLAYKESTLKDKILGLESGKYDRLFKNKDGSINEKSKKDLINDSRKLKKRLEVNKIANRVGDGLEITSKALTTFFPDSDPELLKAVNYGVVATNVIGSITSGNFTAAAMQVLGLFGENQESQETKLIKEVLKEIDVLKEEMQIRFDTIEKRLNIVEQNLTIKLDSISSFLEFMHNDISNMHKETINQLQVTQKQLDGIERKLNCLRSIAIDILNKDINSCNGPYEAISKKFKTNLSFKELESLIENYSCQSCIEALITFFNTKARLSTTFDNKDCKVGSENIIVDSDIYELLIDLWNKEYIDDHQKDAILALLYPSKLISENQKVFINLNTRLPKESKNIVFTFKGFDAERGSYLGASPKFKSYHQIKAVGNYLLLFFPMIEIHKGGSSFYSYDELLNSNITSDRLEYLASYISYMKDVVDFHLAQQSLMSGNLMIQKITDYLGSSDPKIIETTFGILEYNHTVTNNFANYLIALNFNRIEATNPRNPILLYDLNGLKISYERSANVSTMNFSRVKKGTKKPYSVKINLPPFSILNEKPEMIFTEGFYDMIELRKRLVSKIKEINFILNLDNENFVSAKEYHLLLENFKQTK